MNDHVADPLRSILNAAIPVTDFRIDQVEIAADDYARLPADTRRLIETYGSRHHYVGGSFRFEIAIYRWDEIQRTLRRVAP